MNVKRESRYASATNRLGAVMIALLVCGGGHPALAAKVAVFADGNYVDTVDDDVAEAEEPNVEASLGQLGHTVRTFTGVSSDAFATALIGQDVLLIPELEQGDLAPALSPAARAVIASFVRNGGGLIVQSAYPNTLATVDAILGITLVPTVQYSSTTLQAEAAGTAFAGGPQTVPYNDDTRAVAAPLPAGGRAIYALDGTVTVAHFREEFGQLVVLGWDWWNASPRGYQDAGWLAVLDAAVRQVANRCGNGALDPGERCDDGNQAAGDCCSPTCDLDAAGTTCSDDGNSCTADTCDGAGVCRHGAPCDDGEPCTDDVCTAGVCTNPIRSGPCDDGNACTSGDTCQAGVCSGAGVSCEDGNACTADLCDPATGCQNTPVTAGTPCDDHDTCGPDACDATAQCVEVNKKACDATNAQQRGRFQIRMEWAPEVATPGVDFCIGQALLSSTTGGEEAVSNEVKGVVSPRTHRAVLKLRLNSRGKRALQELPRGGELRLVLRMDIHKGGGSPTQIRLLQVLQRRK
jgi:cysteine-rich repeat protein